MYRFIGFMNKLLCFNINIQARVFSSDDGSGVTLDYC